jgi:16S rRNA (uracil1498-N3)-methyltransferase
VSKPLRVPLEGLEPGIRELTGPIARYVGRVHRLGPGAALLLFDPALGVEADASILDAGQGLLRCTVGPVRPSHYRAYPVGLILGLAKGEKPDTTLRDATALGVAWVVFAETARGVVRVSSERAPARLVRWQRIAAEAARQSGRGDVPRIEGPMAIADALTRAHDSRRIRLDPGGPPLLERLEGWRVGESLELLVGPEGGLSPEEIQAANARGFLPASLGPTILRSELASVAALGTLVAFASARGIR